MRRRIVPVMAEASQEDRRTSGDSNLKNYLLQDLEIKTKSVEAALAPLISQVTTLASQPDGSDPAAPTRRHHKAPKLAQALDMAVEQFIVVGEKIARDNPDMEGLMMDACQNIRTVGAEMHKQAGLFAEEPSSSTKRAAMVFASRTLLGAVAKLLVLADIADVNKLLKASQRIEEHLKNLRCASSMEELHESWHIFAPEVVSLMRMVHKRQMDLKDDLMRERIAAARAVFDKSSKMFLTCAETYLSHRGTSSAQENRDYILSEMRRALKTIAVVVDGDDLSKLSPSEVIVVPLAEEGEVERSLMFVEHFASTCLKCAPSAKEKEEVGQKVVIISRAAEFLSESSNTRESSKKRIVAGCETLQEGTQKLLQGLGEVGLRKEGLRALQKATYALEERTRGVRRELRHAMTEHVSDMFVDACFPASELVDVAEKGDQLQVERNMATFLQHARSLEKVATLASSLSGNCEGVKLVKYIAEHMMVLAPQMVNAAETLAGNPTSQPAKENLVAFKDFWGEIVEGMTDAVDITVSIQDFMAVSEVHMAEDVRCCFAAVTSGDPHGLDEEVLLVKGRCMRLMRVLRSNIEENPTRYTGGHETGVLSAVEQLGDKVLPQFCDKGELIVSALLAADPQPVDTSALQQVTTELLDCVSSLRKRVLLTLSSEDLAGDLESLAVISKAQGASREGIGVLSEVPPQGSCPTTQERSTVKPENSTKESEGVSPDEGASAAQHALAGLPEEDQRRLAEASQGLQEQHAQFETEAHHWAGQSGTPDNDCVMLAKQMCGMLLDMSDFTRGQGPLKNTDDVIQRAQEIARAAGQLDKLARSFTDECPDPSCRADLLAYLNQVRLCSHQLRITSSVKADLRSSVRETVESANALITAAKNLMAAVVQTVKLCYIASKAIAKVKGHLPNALLQWEMCTPRKKDLVGASYVEHHMGQGSPRTGESPSMNRMDSTIKPLKELGEFRGKGYQSSSV